MTKTRKTAYALMVAAGMLASTNHALSGSLFKPDNVIVIRGDRGGEVIRYALRAKRYQKNRTNLRFSGRCDSACTIFLSMPKNRVCITRGATFGFHLAYGSSRQGNASASRYMIRKYPAWVKSWIKAKGGLSNSIKRMDYEYASKYIKKCQGSKDKKRLFSFRWN